MGLTSPSLKYIISRKKRHNFSGPVLTLGNQDIYACEEDIRDWAKKYKTEIKEPSEIFYSTSSDIPKINKNAVRFIHARTLFEFLGIPEKDYFDIDKFPFDKPKIVHDLQFPIDPEFHGFFNLIIDSGTLEHIFDIRSVMENIVRMTKVGGYVLQFIPAQNMLNHGFYQVCPTFFYDFYTSNGFEIVESYIIEARGTYDRFWKYTQEEDYVGLFFNPKSRLANCFLVRKKEQLNSISLPDQFYYKKLALDSASVSHDFNASGLDKIVNMLRSLIPIRFHGMFFNQWQLLKRLTSKRKYFDIDK